MRKSFENFEIELKNIFQINYKKYYYNYCDLSINNVTEPRCADILAEEFDRKCQTLNLPFYISKDKILTMIRDILVDYCNLLHFFNNSNFSKKAEEHLNKRFGDLIAKFEKEKKEKEELMQEEFRKKIINLLILSEILRIIEEKEMKDFYYEKKQRFNEMMDDIKKDLNEKKDQCLEF